MSSQKKILVTGATGVQGGGVTRYCLESGHFVYALVRDPCSGAAQELARKGAILVQGDLNNRDSLVAAARGMDAVSINLLPEIHDRSSELRQAENMLSAAKASGTISTVFYSSVVKTGQHESFPSWSQQHPMYEFWMSKHKVEERVRAAGFPHWTILRQPFFMQNFHSPRSQFMFPGLDAANTPKVAFRPDTKVDLVDGSDLGKFVAAALSSPTLFDHKEIELAAERPTFAEVVEKLSAARKQTVKLEFYTAEELGAASQNLVIQTQLWMNEVGFEVDLDALSQYGILLTSTAEYFSKIFL